MLMRNLNIIPKLSYWRMILVLKLFVLTVSALLLVCDDGKRIRNELFKQWRQSCLSWNCYHHKLCSERPIDTHINNGKPSGVGFHIKNAFASFTVHNFALQLGRLGFSRWHCRAATLHCERAYKKQFVEASNGRNGFCFMWGITLNNYNN